MLLIEHVHRIVDGDHTDQPPVLIHHRAGDQVILVEVIGDIGLFIGGLHRAETVFGDVLQLRIARRRQDAPGVT